jgi:aspartyl protease/PDZ domain-containing protein
MRLPSLFFLILVLLKLGSTNAWTQAIPQINLPFILNNDHIVIQIRLADSNPLNFLFDSGAGGTLIAKYVADSLGLKEALTRRNVGVAGTHKVGVVKGVALSVGGKDVGNITLLTTDTPLEEMDDGRKIHGIIGYPILSRFVVNINYSEHQLQLYNKSSFTYSGRGQTLPIDIDLNLPIADVKITMYNGVSFNGRFLVDTGARSDIIISAPTVLKYDMAENIGQYYTVRRQLGSSQRRSKIRYGRLASIQFAGYEFHGTPVALSSDNKGILSRNTINGILGNRILQRFNLIFDYSRRVIYLEPSIYIGNEHEVNTSGFDIVFVDGKPFVKNLIDRSPADIAGIRNDDEIISINSQLVENLSAEEIRSTFLKSDEKLEIVIKRGKKFLYTEITLKKLI